MGKQKKKRSLHSAAPKPPGSKDGRSASPAVEVVDMEPTSGEVADSSPFLGSSNPFRGISINQDSLTKQLPELDARSTITSKTLKGLRLKKKEKQKLRHDLWLKKMNAIESERRSAKEKKKKEQTPVVGDIGSLGDALPTLELLLKGSQSTKHSREENRKSKCVQKEHTRKQQMLADISLFHQVLEHPAYKEDPTGTISEHLKNKLRQEEDMNS